MYLLLVTFVLDRGGEAPGLSIACAVVPFQLVMMSIVAGIGSVQARRSIVLNMGFRRPLIPLASVLTETIAFASSLALLVLMMILYRVPPTPAILWMPVLIAVTFAFSVSVAYPAALLSIWWRELRAFAVSAARTLFFIAPGLVALADVPGSAADWLKLNPLTGIFESYRAALLYGRSPEPWMLAVPLVYTAVLLAVAVPAFRRDSVHFGKVAD